VDIDVIGVHDPVRNHLLSLHLEYAFTAASMTRRSAAWTVPAWLSPPWSENERGSREDRRRRVTANGRAERDFAGYHDYPGVDSRSMGQKLMSCA
jgi:hypothetical protein